tara:strand:+ start:19 stop:279 length:261 start_codon:yes stop_codon:yes gene_type:complete
MPKVIAEIKTFTAGIVSTPDSRDIPSEAADYSLNVEPISSDGKIMGRKGDTYKSTSGGFTVTSLNALTSTSDITVGVIIDASNPVP